MRLPPFEDLPELEAELELEPLGREAGLWWCEPGAGVAPELGERPALSLGRSGPAGSCWGEREVIWMKLVRGDVHLYEPPLLTVTLTPFCSLGSLRIRSFQKVFRSSNKLTKSHSKTLLPRNQVNLFD